MDFFGQLATQVKELYGRLTFSQKTAFVLLVTVVVGALVLFTRWGSQGEYLQVTREPLGAAERDVISALEAAGIKHRQVGGALEVAAPQYNEAMAILATHGIVPGDQIKIRLADIAKEDKMFRTSEDKRAARMVALQDWLADVITHMENIRAASVAIDAPDDQGFTLQDERGTAAVHVWLKPGVERLSKSQVNGIAALVSGVRRTIRKSDVGIIDSRGLEYRVGSEESGGEIVGDRQEQQLAVERELARQVREMLGHYNPVKVMVRLKIDFDRKTEETTDVDPEKAVDVETRRETTESTSTGPKETMTTTSSTDKSAGTPAPVSTETKDSRYAKREIYRKVTHLAKAPGDILDMSVSVFVPREQVIEQVRGRGVAVDEKDAEPAVAGELETIRKSLMTMLLVEKESNITVQAVTFPKPTPLAEPASVSPAAQIWPKHGKTIVLGALSLLALFLLWRMVKKPVEVVIGPGPGYEDEKLLAGTEIPGALRAEKMEQKVTEMVKKNPGEAASLVSRWVQSEG